MNKEYGNSSIERREGADRVRDDPSALLGSSGLDGAKQTVIEIIGNATDEKLSGFGNKLIVSIHEDNSISVRDFGRGVPLGFNEKLQEWNYFLIYEDLYAGGKYADNQDILRKIDEENNWKNFNIFDYPYLISIGRFGLGAACTQYSSRYFTVSSFRDGKKSTMDYEKGKHILDELKIEDTDEPNGTYVRWLPDDKVFTDVNIPVKWLRSLCKSLSYVAGFEVEFINKGISETFKSSNIYEHMKDETDTCIQSRNFIHVLDNRNDICVCDCQIAIGTQGSGLEFYHNLISVEGGSHSRGVDYALGNFFRNVLQGIKLKTVDYSGKFSFIVSTLTNKSSTKGQTKDLVDDYYIQECIERGVLDTLEKHYNMGTPWVVKIVNEVKDNALNRLRLEEMSKTTRTIEKQTKNIKASNSFKGCRQYDMGNYTGCELFVVEGDSAGGRALTARDSNFQCILQIRGKSLNLYKATIEKLIQNKEIRDFIAACGCGIELEAGDYSLFDISKLRFDKIILMPDADVDGKHIAMLEFLKIFKLMPELLYQGRVYIALTPLYSIITTQGEQIYCMDNKELDEVTERIGRENIATIDRFKGHGETSQEGLWNTSMNPATRTLKQIKIDKDDSDLYSTLEALFGTSTALRKKALLGAILGTDYDETIEEIDDFFSYIEENGTNDIETEVVEY